MHMQLKLKHTADAVVIPNPVFHPLHASSPSFDEFSDVSTMLYIYLLT